MNTARDVVKENLLKENADSFEIENFWIKLEPRKRMAAWMNGYLHEVVEKVEDQEIKNDVMEKLNEYEKKNKIQIQFIKQLQTKKEFKEAFSKGRKTFSSWVKSQKELKEYRYILIKLYDFGLLEKIPDFELRRSLFKMIYGRK